MEQIYKSDVDSATLAVGNYFALDEPRTREACIKDVAALLAKVRRESTATLREALGAIIYEVEQFTLAANLSAGQVSRLKQITKEAKLRRSARVQGERPVPTQGGGGVDDGR